MWEHVRVVAMRRLLFVWAMVRATALGRSTTSPPCAERRQIRSAIRPLQMTGVRSLESMQRAPPGT